MSGLLPDFPGELGEVLTSLTDNLTDPSRPFTGQSWTDDGERGKTEVKGVRFRDLADCVVKALVGIGVHSIEDDDERSELYARIEDGTLNYNDVYRLDFSSMDPLALVKSVSCYVEKAMGIFPNVPELEDDGRGNGKPK